TPIFGKTEYLKVAKKLEKRKVCFSHIEKKIVQRNNRALWKWENARAAVTSRYANRCMSYSLSASQARAKHANLQQAPDAAHGQTVLPDPASVNISDSES